MGVLCVSRQTSGLLTISSRVSIKVVIYFLSPSFLFPHWSLYQSILWFKFLFSSQTHNPGIFFPTSLHLYFSSPFVLSLLTTVFWKGDTTLCKSLSQIKTYQIWTYHHHLFPFKLNSVKFRNPQMWHRIDVLREGSSMFKWQGQATTLGSRWDTRMTTSWGLWPWFCLISPVKF